MSPIVSGSAGASDTLSGTGACGTVRGDAYPDRCGYGPRQPLMVVSPYAKQNYVDHTLTDQTSVLRFIEDNWHLGQIGDQSFDDRAGTIENMFDFDAPTAPKVFLDEQTGAVTRTVDTAPPVQTPTTTVTQTVTTPGATQTVTTPGPTVTTPGQTVTTPGPTVVTPGPTVVKEVPSRGTKAPKVTLRCTTSGSAKKIAVSCSVKGRAPSSSSETAVRVRLMKGTSVLATARGILEHGRVKTTLRPKHTAKKGSYTLAVTVTQPGTVSAQHQTIHI